jgi:hypothetical protein
LFLFLVRTLSVAATMSPAMERSGREERLYVNDSFFPFLLFLLLLSVSLYLLFLLSSHSSFSLSLFHFQSLISHSTS